MEKTRVSGQRVFHAALRAFGVPVRLNEASDLNHFEICTTLADPDGVLCQEVLRLINDVSSGGMVSD
jgi:hypothetical protein